MQFTINKKLIAIYRILSYYLLLCVT